MHKAEPGFSPAKFDPSLSSPSLPPCAGIPLSVPTRSGPPAPFLRAQLGARVWLGSGPGAADPKGHFAPCRRPLFRDRGRPRRACALRARSRAAPPLRGDSRGSSFPDRASSVEPRLSLPSGEAAPGLSSVCLPPRHGHAVGGCGRGIPPHRGAPLGRAREAALPARRGCSGRAHPPPVPQPVPTLLRASPTVPTLSRERSRPGSNTRKKVFDLFSSCTHTYCVPNAAVSGVSYGASPRRPEPSRFGGRG